MSKMIQKPEFDGDSAYNLEVIEREEERRGAAIGWGFTAAAVILGPTAALTSPEAPQWGRTLMLVLPTAINTAVAYYGFKYGFKHFLQANTYKSVGEIQKGVSMRFEGDRAGIKEKALWAIGWLGKFGKDGLSKVK